MRKITEIVIHCTATNPSWYADKSATEVVNEIRRWHTQERGWSDIGYHYVIHRDGTIAQGRDVSRSGAHTRGKNKESIGIALTGGRGSASTDEFLDNFTTEQEHTLRNLLKMFGSQYPSIVAVSGHNDHAAKSCPGFNVKNWLEKR
jgi:N-acetylmuramoyl-L-alanine amidase